MTYDLLSQSRKRDKHGCPNKGRGSENFLKKIRGSKFIRDPSVCISII